MISFIKNCRSKMSAFLFLIAMSTILHGVSLGAGTVDSTFDSYLGKVGKGTASKSVIQPDGKIIVSGGGFNMVNGSLKYNIFRLNTDGTLDTTFNSPTISGYYGSNNIEAIALQSDGKIIIAGTMNIINGVIRSGIARLNPDGSLDTTFNNNPSLANIVIVYDMKISPDDKIVFGGLIAGGTYKMTRLNPDGSLDVDMTLTNLPFRLDIQPDGKIVYYANQVGVRRLNQDLTPDNTYSQVTTNNAVYLIKALPDGRTLIGGIFTQVNGTNAPALVRINIDGSIDTVFAANISGVGTAFGSAVVILPDGKIVVPKGDGNLSLRNADGTADTSFESTTNFNRSINDLDLQPDGKIIVSGSANPDALLRTLVVRINPNGSLDNSFQTAIGRFDYGDKVKVLPDDKFLVSGSFNYVNGVARHNLVKFNADGTLDTTFDQNVIFNTPPIFDVFPNGKIVARNVPNIVILNSDGSLDFTFPNAINFVNDIKALPDGKVLVANGNNQLERYNSDGTLDGAFNVTANSTIYQIALQEDGKILIGGNFTQVNGTDRSKIARLNADGTLDTSFNSPSGGINGVIINVLLSPGGKFIIRGTFSGISFNTRERLARLNSDGSLDLDFVPPRSYSFDDVKVQPDGKVLLVGPASGHPVMWKLNANGSLDTTFNITVTTDNTDDPRIRGVDLQSDGKIIVTGDFLRINGVLAPGIARLFNNAKVLFDFDGDGKSDVSVFRPSTSRWYEILSSNSSNFEATFGVSGDLVAPADFDGDGKTDLATFRPSTGTWWYVSSVDNTQHSIQFGASGDIPRPSDFDGDGKDDFCIFRPSNSAWYRLSSGNGAVSVQIFGTSGDKPLIGDFDGDGKSDITIYRPSTGTWWYQTSSDNVQRAAQWGNSTDIASPADYDGDGKTDFAIYRPSEGVWYILNSSTGQATIIRFGLAEDKPVPADYDGDGKADIAVYRPSEGVWYLLKSTEGFSALRFGISSDIPTPNSFIQ